MSALNKFLMLKYIDKQSRDIIAEMEKTRTLIEKEFGVLGLFFILKNNFFLILFHTIEIIILKEF